MGLRGPKKGNGWKYAALPEKFAADLRSLHKKHTAVSLELCQVLAHARGCGWTCHALGEALGVTRERIRQLAPKPRKSVFASGFSIDIPVAPQKPAKVVKEKVPLKPCGTPAAYYRHLARGEATCAPCRAANVQKQQDFHEKRKAKRGDGRSDH